ncbi:hypothetical protein F2Q70_00040376 [Brassica cretica]|uniref:Uncharacterized protein n=1 Tax=Brassica cretica TaxID=69181 RepID=A0A8S9K1Y3_BRACR|nr:hypothetical protein F2Q70_00040376 [Brassica cretica]
MKKRCKGGFDRGRVPRTNPVRGLWAVRSSLKWKIHGHRPRTKAVRGIWAVRLDQFVLGRTNRGPSLSTVDAKTISPICLSVMAASHFVWPQEEEDTLEDHMDDDDEPYLEEPFD